MIAPPWFCVYLLLSASAEGPEIIGELPSGFCRDEELSRLRPASHRIRREIAPV
jgi:hypothetical protein